MTAKVLAPIPDAVPAALRSVERWICWRARPRDGGKLDKVPHSPHTGRRCDALDPANWGSFDQALAAMGRHRLDGLGIVLTGDDALVGVDLDGCLKEDGVITPWAREIVVALDSYTERSPSGRGLRMLAFGHLPPGRRAADGVEMYDRARFLTITGHHLAGTPTSIERRDDALQEVHARYLSDGAASAPADSSTGRGDPPSLDELRAMLRCIPSRLTYDEWLHVLMAVHEAYPGPEGVALCEKWSPGYDGEIAKKFASFKRDAGATVGIGTVIHLAEQGGWQPPKSRVTSHKRSAGTTNGHTSHPDDFRADVDPRTGETLCPEGKELPAIIVNNRPLRDVTANALTAMITANRPPQVYVRSGTLCRVRADEDGHPIIDAIGEAELRGRLARVANFVRITQEGESRHVPPPIDMTRDMLALGQWDVPALAAVVEVPTLRPDGSIFAIPGYDETTRTIYAPSRALTMPRIPETPTSVDVQTAATLLQEPFADFPFQDAPSRANALALAITTIVRPAIKGPVPMALLDKPTPGTGASLCAEVVAHIATGHAPGMASAPGDDDEMEKRITAVLRDGETFICIDNVDQPLDYGSLSRVLTCHEWAGRILGRSEQARYPNRAVWVATGNNMTLRGDIARRAYWIRMIPGDAQPWRTTREFRHPRLTEWVEEHRGEIVGAVLTLARAWFAQGCPQPATPTLGKFEEWCRIVGGILAMAGIDGFLGNLDELYSQVDEEAPEWEAFLAAWSDHYGGREVSAGDLTADLRSTDKSRAVPAGQTDPPPIPTTLVDLRASLPGDLAEEIDNPRGSFDRKLGRALAKHADRRYGKEGHYLKKGGTAGRTKWLVTSTKQEPLA